MKWIKEKADYIYFITLLICCYKFTYHLYSYLDISLVDEHAYLWEGVTHKMDIEYAPIYALWYYFLSFFTKNNIDLMFLNFSVLTILFTLTTFLCLRKLRINPALSFYLSFLMLICQFNLSMAPKVVILMNLLQLLILALSARIRNVELRNIFIAFFLFIAYYIRAEYKIGFFLFFIYILINYAYNFYKGRKLQNPVAFVILVVALIMISLFVGFPFKNQSGKEFLAFGSSFALNYVKWHHLPDNPWTSWFYLVREAFGNVTSPMQAMIANPELFFMHVFSNLRNYSWIFLHHITQVFIPWQFLTQSVFSAILFVLLIAGSVLFYFKNYRLNFRISSMKEKIKRFSFPLFICLILIIPNMISIMIITTRYHYISLELPVFTVLIALCASVVTVSKNDEIIHPSKLIFALYISFIVILLTPFPSQNKLLAAAFKDRINVKIAEKINALPLNGKKINSLNCDLIIFTKYPAENTHYVLKSIGFNNVVKETPFNDYLKEHHFNFIGVDDDILNSRGYKNDPQWQHFITDYNSYGFVKMQPDSNYYYLVSKELLK
ncbi:MAG: hypothetical protein JWN78_1716 [Bacteroidota bacterium]|nr:hypothetical protein [Bacteroidota bacterium]